MQEIFQGNHDKYFTIYKHTSNTILFIKFMLNKSKIYNYFYHNQCYVKTFPNQHAGNHQTEMITTINTITRTYTYIQNNILSSESSIDKLQS